MQISVVVRTLNEARHLGDLLQGVRSQQGLDQEPEVVVVDSGSSDGTLDIAASFDCRIEHISKDEFSFGRSLNIGCKAARGDILVFVSGHCIPENNSWLVNLVRPVREGRAQYAYGRQVGAEHTKFSERQLFEKYYPATSSDPQEGFFCNNANAALLRDAWARFGFDESLTGLEDMELAKRMIADGIRISYIANAGVYHLHEEPWSAVRTRYEREALALQKIMPEVHVGRRDVARYFLSGVLHDLAAAVSERKAMRLLGEIIMFRAMQYWGTYRGNHEHRRLSHQMKEKYFYPK